MISCQTNQWNHLDRRPCIDDDQCIIPSSDELNYETSQVKCPHRNNSSSEKCQKLFKNIMALNVHLQMCHKEMGIITASTKYTSRVGHYHCPIDDCAFRCRCGGKSESQSLSFSNFNAVRLHYLRQHGLKTQQCSKCSKPFGLHQDLIAHEKICGIRCPFSCSNCAQQFQNRTSLRRHQLKYHSDLINNSQNNHHVAISTGPSSSKFNERRKRPIRRRRLPPDQVEFARQIIPPSSYPTVTINPLALALLKNFTVESPTASASGAPALPSAGEFESDSDKATQTETRVSVGTECCSLTSTDLSLPNRMPTLTAQKSIQTSSRIRVYKKRPRYYARRSTATTTTTTTIDDKVPSSISTLLHTMQEKVFGSSIMSQWENVHVTDMETQISSPSRTDMCIQTVGSISNLLDYPSPPPLPTSPFTSDPINSVTIQTLPISMTSTQMQTIAEHPRSQQEEHQSKYNYLLPYQESVGTSCFLDDFLLDDLAKNDNKDSPVLFDFDAIDLLDLMDSATQTNASITTNETQTMPNWDILLPEDEWLRAIMNN